MARLRKYRWWLLTLAALAVGAGVWWWGQPREMRLVSVRKLPSLATPGMYTLIATRDRLYLWNNNGQMGCCAWDGTLLWQRDFFSRGVTSWGFQSNNFAVSPDGHWFLSSTLVGTQRHWILVHDGQDVASGAIPFPAGEGLLEVYVQNSCRVWAQLSTTTLSQIECLDNMRITACLQLPNPGKNVICAERLAPDGSGYVLATPQGFTYFALTEKPGTIRAIRQYSVSEPSCSNGIVSEPTFIAGGRLVGFDGALYDGHGVIRPDTDYETSIEPGVPLPEAVIQQQMSNAGSSSRVLLARSGAIWTIRGHINTNNSKISPDGSEVIGAETLGRANQIFCEWLSQSPMAGWLFRYGKSHAVPLLVFCKPGHCVARLSNVFAGGHMHFYDRSSGKEWAIDDFMLTPDNRALYTTARLADDSNTCYLLKFTW